MVSRHFEAQGFVIDQFSLLLGVGLVVKDRFMFLYQRPKLSICQSSESQN